MDVLHKRTHHKKRIRCKIFTSTYLKKIMSDNPKPSTSSPEVRAKRNKFNSKDSLQNLPSSRRNLRLIINQRIQQIFHKNCIVYRCQLTSKEDTCCCACNSDAMFEIMKGLYDCYKKKNCDKCKCILCGHLPLEKRKVIPNGLNDAEKKEMLINALADMVGKSSVDKERILRELAMANVPLPEPRSLSEADLIKKVRKDLGLPPEPENTSERTQLKKLEDAGFGAIPLEGKSPDEKYRILKGDFDLGGLLPEGRNPSEISLINKIKKGVPKIPSNIFHIEKSPQGKKKNSERSTQLPEAKPSKSKMRRMTQSPRLRAAKAAGLLTPLQGKTPQQKDQILKGLANIGLPLPEPTTPSEKKLIDKVRADLGLPPEPTNPALREKYKKAANEGLLIPLEGKTPAEKENILHGLLNNNIALPEGRTPSEKAIIATLKQNKNGTPTEKIRKTKIEGLSTKLTGKTPEQIEKNLKKLAILGLPLPEGKTSSEKKIIEQVRANLGLPPEPRTPSLRDKYEKAANAGVLMPLEGKTPVEKENILKKLMDRGIPLPEGRTPSEKALIVSIKATHVPKIPSEKLRKAKAAGLLTPLTGKSPEEKENILKRLALMGLPLPEGKSPAEKKIVDRVRMNVGLPQEPKTPSLKVKYHRAINDGVLVPLEGKTPAEKENILRKLRNKGIPLPEGRTPSEKALIAKVKKESFGKIPSEKLRKAKEAGILTPLTGKTPERKENIVRGLAMAGLPLPVGNTASEKKLIDKIRAELGLPQEPKTPSLKEKYNRALHDGILVPLEGKTDLEKENILKKLRSRGLPLPEGRTPSEKGLLAKVKKEAPSYLDKISSENLRKAKAAGLLTPLTGKTPEKKEKIIRGLAMAGLPLPDAQTASEKRIIEKIRKELGLPPEPKTSWVRDKYNKAARDGIIVPLQGKTPEAKEKILQDRGLPITEGLHKDKTSKEMKEGQGPSEECICGLLSPESKLGNTLSEKLREARAAGFLTPLEGKTPEQKERLLIGLAKRGLPLPESKTNSDRQLGDKIRARFGLPPEPRTPSMKQKYANAAASGLLTPLNDKTPAQLEKILRGLADTGIPLPEGRTPSEKALIAAIKGGLAKPSTMTEKKRKAKLAGLLTPLEGKTPEQKENILRKLASIGLPLPEGKTPSDRELIRKVKLDSRKPKVDAATNISKKNKPAPTPSEKLRKAAGLLRAPSTHAKLSAETSKGTALNKSAVIREKARAAGLSKNKTADIKIAPDKLQEAKSAGLITPLNGKSLEQKEKIIRGLALAGLPLPEGKTQSERDLLKKIRRELGLPTEPQSPSMKEKLRKAYGDLLVAGKRPKATLPLQTEIKPKKKKSTSRKSKLITDDSTELVKTTKCDQACGCDKKKIKFKHSYVKIRVTSPDLSSICPCPEECFPRIKSEITNENAGIKITIGSAIYDSSFFDPLRRYLDTTIDTLRWKKRFSDSDISYASSKANPSLHYPRQRLNFVRSDLGTLSTYYSKVYRKNDSLKYIMKCRKRCESKESLLHRLGRECDNSLVCIRESGTLNRVESSEGILFSFTDSSSESFSMSTSSIHKLQNCYSTISLTTNSVQSLYIVKTETSLYFKKSKNLGSLNLIRNEFQMFPSLSSRSRCYLVC